MCGINTRAWDNLPFDPYTTRGNIWCSAYILKHYLDLSNGNYLEAITHYKGYSPLGRLQAKRVLTDL